VVEQVDAHGGRVKIGGEVWSARAYVSSQVIPPGVDVDVVILDGVTALVYPKELP
jgi:membrane protein implicated in regulation of membrane protease activity